MAHIRQPRPDYGLGFQVKVLGFRVKVLKLLPVRLEAAWPVGPDAREPCGVRVYGFHMQTLIIYKLGFNQNYYTFTLILLIKIVLYSKFP